MKKLADAMGRRLPAFLLLLSLSGGCAAQPPVPQPSFFDEWKARAETSKPLMEPAGKPLPDNLPASAAAADASPAAPAASNVAADLPDQTISVRFVNDELINVLRALGRMAGQNILISPSVKGSVNAHIENTPWNVVFSGLINSYGLILVQEPNLLRIMTLEDMKQQVEKESLQKEKQQSAPLATRFFPIEYANPDEILESVKPLLSKNADGSARGSAAVDKHSRSLIVSDTAADLQHVADIIERLDKSTPQILIEAHIVETNRDTARELGVQWGSVYHERISDSQTLSLTPGGINGRVENDVRKYDAGVDGKNRGGIGQQGFGVDLPAAAIGNINPASIGLLLESLSGNVLELQLSALQQDGKVNILSQPSIITLDNNQAVIESGRDIPYQTIEDGSVKIEYKEASLKLTVTPHVINDNLIRLDIDAKKDEVDFSPSAAVAGNPSIIKKQARTQLIVENGSTVVIAGLSKEHKADGNTGVPGLKQIPGLGWLFKTDSRSSTFEDLLIFISPKILTREKAG
ncbi:MAG: type IV pilus secretin PilQ [Thermodesulfobacteriota bacterium]